MNTSNSVFGRCRREDEAEDAVFLKAAFLLLIFSGVVCSQEFRANLTGRVTDPSGSPVPGASVQVKNTGTNEIAAGATDAQGSYTAPLLRPGVYSVTIEAPGSKNSRARISR